MLFDLAIINPSKQVGPHAKCNLELYKVIERRENQIAKAQPYFDSIMRFLVVYAIFILCNTLYDMLYWIIKRGRYKTV